MSKLEIGKVPVDILNRIVLDPINNNINKRKDIVVRPSTGEDCSAVDPGGEICVLSTDPITAAGSNACLLYTSQTNLYTVQEISKIRLLKFSRRFFRNNTDDKNTVDHIYAICRRLSKQNCYHHLK